MKRYYLIFGDGSKVNQIACAVLIYLPVFAYGASIGWMSPMSLLLQSPHSPRHTPLTDTEVSWMAASSYLVCIAGNFFMSTLCHRGGRKLALFVMSAAAAMSWVLKLSSLSSWSLTAARALVGLTMSGAHVTCPLYVKDISDVSLRGALGTMVTVAHTSGVLFLYVIGNNLSYRGVLWTCLSLPAAHLALMLLMPESPIFLLKSGKLQEARLVLSWLRCRREEDPLLDEELVSLRRDLTEDHRHEYCALKAILKDSVLLRAFSISVCVGLARELSGAISVLNFAGDIFSRASGPEVAALSPNQQAMVIGAVQVLGSIIASLTIEKSGRKPLLAGSALVSGLSMCALASWFVARQYYAVGVEWLPMVTLSLCIFCDSAGLQRLAFIVIGDMFPNHYRGAVMAIVMSMSSLTDFLQLLFFKPVANSAGIHIVFYVFGGVCLLTAVYVILVVPETKTRTVEQIQDDIRTSKHNKRDQNIERNIETQST